MILYICLPSLFSHFQAILVFNLTFHPEHVIVMRDGELSEGFKEPVLKTGDGATHREFESHTLRQCVMPPLGGITYWQTQKVEIRKSQMRRG